MARAEAYLHAKFHLDPPQYINVTDRQDMTGQTINGPMAQAGRTVLQTVAPKG